MWTRAPALVVIVLLRHVAARGGHDFNLSLLRCICRSVLGWSSSSYRFPVLVVCSQFNLVVLVSSTCGGMLPRGEVSLVNFLS